MFSPKKPRVSKDQLKKAVVSANKKLVSANARLKKDIEANRAKLKDIENNYEAHRKALEDTKELQVFANNELEGTQLEISTAQTEVKEVLSKFSKLTEESNSLEVGNKKLEDKSVKLAGSIALLEGRKEELDILTADIKQIREEAAIGQESLELLAVELNELEAGVESYLSRKSAAESEFRVYTGKIEREKNIVRKELDNIKDRMAEATFACGKEMGRLDKAIAERLSELRDMEELIKKKDYEFVVIQSKIGSVERQVKDTEDRIEYSIKKEKDRVNKIKGDFKDWKVQALDEVARKKIKGQIENIDKAGLKEVLDG